MDKLFSEVFIQKFGDFNEFVNKGLLVEKPIQEYIHFKSQLSFLVNHHNLINVDYIGKVESIESDFSFVCKKLKINARLPKINISSRENLPAYEMVRRSRLRHQLCLGNIYKNVKQPSLTIGKQTEKAQRAIVAP